MVHAIRDHAHETLASKADLHMLGQRLEVHFSQVEQELERRLVGAQSGMIKWFAGAMVAQAVAIVVLIKLLPGPS